MIDINEDRNRSDFYPGRGSLPPINGPVYTKVVEVRDEPYHNTSHTYGYDTAAEMLAANANPPEKPLLTRGRTQLPAPRFLRREEKAQIDKNSLPEKKGSEFSHKRSKRPTHSQLFFVKKILKPLTQAQRQRQLDVGWIAPKKPHTAAHELEMPIETMWRFNPHTWTSFDEFKTAKLEAERIEKEDKEYSTY